MAVGAGVVGCCRTRGCRLLEAYERSASAGGVDGVADRREGVAARRHVGERLVAAAIERKCRIDKGREAIYG